MSYPCIHFMTSIANLKNGFFTVMLYSVFAIDTLAYLFEANFFTRWAPFLLGLFFLIYIAFRSIEFTYIALVASVSFLCCMLYNQDSSMNILTILINLALGWYIYLNRPGGKPLPILLVLLCLSLGFKIYTSGGDVERILISGSQNYISVAILSVSLLYYTFVPKKDELLAFYPAIAAVLLSILATGRSGIVASLILIIGVYLYNFSFVKKSKLVIFIYLSAGFLGIGCIFQYQDILYNVADPSSLLWRFTMEHQIDGRMAILQLYFSEFSLADFFYGRGNGLIKNSLNLSVHISYLQWHISLGFLAIPIYALVLFAYIKMLVINRLYFILMTVLLVRAATDHIMLTAGFIFGPLLVYYCMRVYFPHRYPKLRVI
jgi:hypothetical protein